MRPPVYGVGRGCGGGECGLVSIAFAPGTPWLTAVMHVVCFTAGFIGAGAALCADEVDEATFARQAGIGVDEVRREVVDAAWLAAAPVVNPDGHMGFGESGRQRAGRGGTRRCGNHAEGLSRVAARMKPQRRQ